MQSGQQIETNTGWLLDVLRIDWWTKKDGAVWGRMRRVRGGKWSTEKYIGTVLGIERNVASVRFANQS